MLSLQSKGNKRISVAVDASAENDDNDFDDITHIMIIIIESGSVL
jgi:hypothetical protein